MLQTLPCVVIRDEPRDLCTVTVFMALFFNLDKNFKAASTHNHSGFFLKIRVNWNIFKQWDTMQFLKIKMFKNPKEKWVRDMKQFTEKEIYFTLNI